MSTASNLRRVRALAAWTGYPANTYSPDGYTDNVFTDGGAEYLVLTDSEADDAVSEDVANSLWAFNAEFLASHTGLPVEVFTALSEECEEANEPIRRIVDATGNFDELVDEAVLADGRGHFLARYDGEEVELDGDLYAYRVN
jgi:hypothetical protein